MHVDALRFIVERRFGSGFDDVFDEASTSQKRLRRALAMCGVSLPEVLVHYRSIDNVQACANRVRCM
jgi:hypothetical protein